MRKLHVLLAAFLCLGIRAGAEILPAEKLLPDDTVIMVTMPDVAKVRDIYHNSPFGQLWNDPAMKDFKDKFFSKLKSEYIAPLEHDLGIHFDDYTNLAQGQFTLAVTENTLQKNGGDAGLLLLLDTKGKSDQLKTNLADLKKKWLDAGKTAKTEKIRDIDFSIAVISPGDMPKSLGKSTNAAPDAADTDGKTGKDDTSHEAKKQIYIGQAESLLIIGNSPKVIEKILIRMSGGSVNALGEVGAFAANQSMFRNAPLFGWINTKALLDAYGKSGDDSDPGTSNPLGVKPDKIMSAIGLNGLKSIAFNYVFTSDGAQFNLQLNVPESSRTGLFKILAGESKEYTPPPFVPADAVKFQRWRLDGQKTYATLRKIVGDISPAGIGGIDFALSAAEAGAKEKDPNFDINKALFGNLGDDMISYAKSPKGATPAELASPPSIFLLGSPNPDELANAVKILFLTYSQGGSAPTNREFLGHKVFSLPLPPVPSADGKSEPRALNYASSGGYLAITTDVSLLEEYLRSSETPPKPLRDLAGLSEATQKVAGSGTSLFGFANESDSTRVMFEALKKDPASGDPLAALTPLAVAMGMSPDIKIKDWLDASLLPTFDKVAKYFYITVYAGSANADGLSFKFYAPVPPQLKKQ